MTEVTMTTGDIVQKLWSLCHILRDDGITYQDYVTELTFLLFLKMMQETGREESLPKGYRWSEPRPNAKGEQLLTTIAPCCSTSATRRSHRTGARYLHRRTDLAAQASQPQDA